jgi:hypothetical protein
MRMSDQGAENVFARLRWPKTDGKMMRDRRNDRERHFNVRREYAEAPVSMNELAGQCIHA